MSPPDGASAVQIPELALTVGKPVAYGSADLSISLLIARRGEQGFYRGLVRGCAPLPHDLTWTLLGPEERVLGTGAIDDRGCFKIPLGLAPPETPCRLRFHARSVEADRSLSAAGILSTGKPATGKPATGKPATKRIVAEGEEPGVKADQVLDAHPGQGSLGVVHKALRTRIDQGGGGPLELAAGRSDIVQFVKSALNVLASPSPAADPNLLKVPARPFTGRVFPVRYPSHGDSERCVPQFVGREQELEQLDQAVKDRERMVCIVGAGGMGKTALLNEWLSRGAGKLHERVVVHSFKIDPAVDRSDSADAFLKEVLTSFGVDAERTGSPFQRAELVLRELRRSPAVLALDGVDALSDPADPTEGTYVVSDPALSMLMDGLAADNPGVCVICCQRPLAALRSRARLVQMHELPERDSARLLQSLVRHTSSPDFTSPDFAIDPELMACARELPRDPLSVSWFGGYVARVLDGDLAQSNSIRSSSSQDLLRLFEKWFAGKPELSVLKLLALANPLSRDLLEYFRCAPPIPLLTDALAGQSESAMCAALDSLRDCRLVTIDADSGDVESHDVVCRHFERQLHKQHWEAWRAGHSRLFEFLRDAPQPPAHTEDALAFWIRAVNHACLSGRYREALHDIYRDRIVCGGERLSGPEFRSFTRRWYGVRQDLLNCLALFFRRPWSVAVPGLGDDEDGEPWLFEEVGHYLFLLGRPREAADVLHRALRMYQDLRKWGLACRVARLLGELHRSAGDLNLAQIFAARALGLAEMTNDPSRWGIERAGYGEVRLCQGRFAEAAEYFRFADRELSPDRTARPLRGYGALWYCDSRLHPLEVAAARRELAASADAARSSPHDDPAGDPQGWDPQDWQSEIALVLERLDVSRRDLARKPHGDILEGLFDVTMARAALLAEVLGTTRELSDVTALLDRGVERLTRAGQQHWLVAGLLARAAAHRARGAAGHQQAAEDLLAALKIAIRAQLRLAEADAHLQFARLHLACGQNPDAARSYRLASRLVDECGYHRRDQELGFIRDRLERLAASDG